ncbi:MAG: ATP-binding protein [Bacillus sp. (in: Bacteria)]|nr:ATP-binding protein [Bacillus sp. (in: firmicutes)]MCM1426770.1 ATP-binding protein [Eubacterium sp.]
MVENDIYMTLLSHVWDVVNILLWAYCFYRFAASFLADKKKAVYGGAAYFIVEILLELLPVLHSYFLTEAITTLAAVFILCLIERTNYVHKIFLGVTFFALGWLVYAMADVLYDNIYHYATKTEYMQMHPNWYPHWFVLWVITSILQYLLWYAFMVMAVRSMAKAYANQSPDMTGKELLMLAVPSFAAVVGYIVIYHYRSFYILEQDGVNGNAYDVPVLLYCAVSVVTIMVVIVQYRHIKTKQEERMQNEMLGAQMESIRQHIGQVENLYRDMRAVRHDMANHLFTLEKLYEENEVEEAKAYSGQLQETLTRMTGEIKSANPVTDIILQETKDKAAERGLSFQSEFYYPEESKVNVFDISVILHNALQNALENTGGGEKEYIVVRSYRKKNAYIIEIKNSYHETLQWNTKSGLPCTTKEKTDIQGYGTSHGYGLSNIRKVAEKYCGGIDITAADGVFCLSVMLML